MTCEIIKSHIDGMFVCVKCCNLYIKDDDIYHRITYNTYETLKGGLKVDEVVNKHNVSQREIQERTNTPVL